MSDPIDLRGYDELMAAAAADERELVRCERSGDRARLVLDDPAKLNVLSAPLVLQLRRRLDELAAEPEVRTVILAGAGRGFSTGGDLRLMDAVVRRLADPGDEEGAATVWRFIRREFGGVVRRVAELDKAVIAAVDGPAAGVGLAFAFASDLVVASQRAVLVPAFGRLGLIPEVGTSWLLTRRLGLQRAFAYYVEGRHIAAHEALELGLVTEVVADDQLDGRLEEWADRVAALPRHALEMAKPLLRGAADAPWEQALRMEEFAEPTCFTTASFGRSVSALVGRDG